MNSTYLTAAGDTWDFIALTIYGDRKYTEFLMNANQSLDLLATVVFDAGVILSTPALPDIEMTDDSTPPWRAT